jgi:hypothetical protein
MPIRVPEGIFRVISEMSKKLQVDKQDVTSMLIFSGLGHVNPDMYSSEGLDLMWTDAVESYVALVRSLSNHTPEHRAKIIKPIKNLYDELEAVFQKPQKKKRGK